MKKYLFLIFAIYIMTSCAMPNNSKEDNSVSNEEMIDPEKEARLVGNEQQVFSVSTLEKILSNGNQVCSPLGIEVLYDIMKTGSRGQTYAELDSLLGIKGGSGKFIAEDLALPSDTKGTFVSMANLVVLNKNFTLKEDYKEKVASLYDSEIWSRDFASSSTLNEINKWAEKKTNGMIKKGIDDLRPDAAMSAVNALYFNGKWVNEFNESYTIPTVFHQSGKKVKVDMMAQTEHFPYLKTKSFQLLALPYSERICKDARIKDFSLYVFLPLQGYGFGPILEYLKGKNIGEIRQEMIAYGDKYFSESYPEVEVRLPKFETETEIDVVSLLKEFGIKSCFGLQADFGDISDEGVYIDESKQKAVIRVDEKGTEAAAVTSVVLSKACVEQTKRAYFHADHPFIYVIASHNPDVIFFIGQYSDGKICKDGNWITDTDIKGAYKLSFKEDEIKTVEDDNPDRVYDICDEMPKYPGGFEALKKYIRDNIKYPEDAIDACILGRVVVRFIVEKDGSISNPRVIRSLYPSMDKEALRIVSSMPKWIPGSIGGKTVRAEYNIPVSFRQTE